MASSTYKTFLMKGSGTTSVTYSKLVDIKDFPDLIGTPDNLDCTTLSDGAYCYCPGLKSNETKTFTCNYDQTTFETLKALEGAETMFSVWFGGTVSGGVATPTGSEGKFNFKGFLTVGVPGKGVNEVKEMTVTITPSTEVEFEAGTT